MRIRSQQSISGNTLMVVLFFCVAIGMVVAGLLKLTSVRYTNSIRSTEWNAAIPVLEAGAEDAMTHLYKDTTPGANNWTLGTYNGVAAYTKQRTFADGSYYFVAIVNATTTTPTIYSQGYVRAPFKSSQYIGRTVMISTTNPPNVFTKAIATTGSITFSGGAYVDGFDSRVGGYNAGTNRTATGNIATDSTNKPAITFSGGDIIGTAVTGPGGTIALSGSASIGDLAWCTNGANSGVESSSWTNNTMNVAYPTNSAPAGPFALWPSLITAGGSNVTMLAGSVSGAPTYYQNTSFTSSSSTGPMLVSGNVVLYLSATGNSSALTVSGSGYIKLLPGASLTIYVAGKTTISGGGVVNGTGLASNFSIDGLNSCNSITYSGSAAYVGTINAPQADLTLSGGSGTYGAVIAKTANVSGSSGFHYDNALGASDGLIATGWKEL